MNLKPLLVPDTGAHADTANGAAPTPHTPPTVPLPDDASVAGEEDPGAALDDGGVGAPITPTPPTPPITSTTSTPPRPVQ